jgi:transketolase
VNERKILMNKDLSLNMESLREAYGRELVNIGRTDDRIVVLEADLRNSTMSNFFAEEIPHRFFEMGIAEQNMMSTAAGFAIYGKIPFTNTFAVFTTGRAYDQVRQSIALPKLNVKIVGSSGGLSDYGDGATHQSVEDLSLMRSIPNMTVIVPVDAPETKKVVRAAIEHEGPVYIRISRNDMPVITKKDDTFEIGKIYKIKDGKDVVIFANGLMVSIALKAISSLEKQGISVALYNVPTLKPLDEYMINEAVSGAKGVVTAEEHSIIGGLGSAICEILSKNPVPVERIGIKDRFGQSSYDYYELLKEYGLTEDAIVDAVMSFS